MDFLLFLFVFLLPTQLGKHFFFGFSFVSGVRIDYLAPTLYLNDLIFLALVLFEYTAILKFVHAHLKKIVLITLFMIVNCAIAPEPLMALYAIARLYQVFFVFLIFAHHKEKLHLIIWALLGGALLQAFLTVGQYINHASLQGPFYFLGERFFTLSTPGIAKASLQGKEILRPYGTFSHPNSLGGFYVLIYALSLTLLEIKNNKKMYYPLMILSALSILLVLISFSKAAIGTLIIISLGSAILFRDKKNDCLPCALSRILVLLVLGAIFYQAQGDSYSVEKRFLLVQQSLVLFQQYPLFGVGFGNHLYLQAQFPTPYPEFFLQPVHNIFLLLLTQGGLIITGLIGWIAVHVAKKEFILLLLAVAITGLVDHYWLTLYQNMLVLGAGFGIVWSLRKTKKLL